MKNIIFLDNAATTKMYPEVFESMIPWLKAECRNASAAYSCAAEAGKAIENAREIIAGTINAHPEEIFFTSGGSESNNWAIKGIADAKHNEGKHIITSCIEHPSILNTCKFLGNHENELTYLNVDSSGMIEFSSLEEAIRNDTVLISIMMANNEIGTIEPVSDIGALARSKHVLFHTDAVQAYGHLYIDVNKQRIDLLSASGHKFGGPQGIGFIFIRHGTQISNLIHGGNQQYSRRAGTENIAAIVGLSRAAELSYRELSVVKSRQSELQKYIINRINSEIPNVTFNGSMNQRLPNNINCTIEHVPGTDLVRLLGQRGICISTASACKAGVQEKSHVLKAIHLSDDMAECTIRITLGRNTTQNDAIVLINNLKELVNTIRTIKGFI